jgi:hypothetical protein
VGVPLDLDRIEAGLRAVEDELARINAELGLALEPLEERVITNMMDGYALVDQLARAGVDVFTPGQSAQLLELNIRVLCGIDPVERMRFDRHIEATRSRFYDHPGGGMGALAQWVKLYRGQEAVSFAAGLYFRVISEPQLFVEGNHRTGFLLMNLELLRSGQPPFVLCPENAPALFAITAGLDRCRGARLSLFVEGSAPRQALAKLLRDAPG